jgi:hypothetical protein
MIPDENPATLPGGNAEAALQPEKKSTANIPASDINLSSVAKEVCVNWGKNPQITLLWTTQPEMETSANAFAVKLFERNTAGTGRSPITQELIALKKKGDVSIEYVKGYLRDKYGKQEAVAWYPECGFVKKGKNWALPSDNQQRIQSHSLLLAALEAQQFAGEKFGVAFWSPLAARFAELVSLSVTTDSSVASLVGTKNQLRKSIVKTLNCLVHAIKANYPDDFKSVLRTWGFQKEKY